MNTTLHPDWKRGPLGYGLTIDGHRATVRAVQCAKGRGFVRRWQVFIDGDRVAALYPSATFARVAAEERLYAKE